MQGTVAVAVDLVQRLLSLSHAVGSLPTTQPVPERALLTPEQAAAALGISRSQIFALLKTGELSSLKLGVSRRIPREAIAEFVRRLEDRQWST